MITPELIMEWGYQLAFVVYLIYISENHLKGIKAELVAIKEAIEDTK